MADLETRLDRATAPKWVVTETAADLPANRRMLIWQGPDATYQWRVFEPGKAHCSYHGGGRRSIATAKREAIAMARQLGWL